MCTAITFNQSVLLVNGVPQVSRLSTLSDIDFYQFTVYAGAGHQDIYFTINARYGDPDVFIRNDGECIWI